MVRSLSLFLLLVLPGFADPLECLPEGTVGQISERLMPGTVIYRDCYFCQEPAMEQLRIEKAEIRPCHLRGLEDERAIYITATVERRFKLADCNKVTWLKAPRGALRGELLVLNYTWSAQGNEGLFLNLADAFGENSHNLCKQIHVPVQAKKARAQNRSK